jgi:hypothetical protein
LGDIHSLREDMQELEEWDKKYFIRRKAKIAELEDLVQSIIDITVEEYLREAKRVLDELEETKEMAIKLLEKKMQVSLPEAV